MPRRMSGKAPTRLDQKFHHEKPEYADNSLTLALQQGAITAEDEMLIRGFMAEQLGTRGISPGRVNKMTFNLVGWRRFIGPYTRNTIFDLYAGIANIKSARTRYGTPYKQNTQHDYVRFLKRFYRWLIEHEYSAIREKDLMRIQTPKADTMTKTADQMLTPEEILALIHACASSRDRALITCLYEGGLRPKEVASLTWNQVLFDDNGIVLNINIKTEYPRYIRLVTATPYLAQWKVDYPFDPSGEALVFLSGYNKPIRYAGLAKQLKVLCERAGITKHVTPHMFRHTRLTHLQRQKINDPILKKMFWGHLNTRMLSTYSHLTGEDTDDEILGMYGISRADRKQFDCITPSICPHCNALNGPTMKSCVKCGQSLLKEESDRIEKITREIEKNPLYIKLLMELRDKLAGTG